MSSVGFKGFAKPRTIDEETRKDFVENIDEDYYVLYTGGKYSRRKASGRSKSLSLVTEKGRPISARDYATRAAKIGFDTSISIGGLGLHQGAKPAVYLYLYRDGDGNYRAVKDIPNPDPSAYPGKREKGGFKADEIVVPKKDKSGSKEVARK